MDLIRKSVEQMRAEAVKRSADKQEQENRKNMYLEQETRRQNQANAFANHVQKIKNNEDKIVKSVLNVKQAEDEYQQMLSANGISDSNELKDKMSKILGDNLVSAYHVRQITMYAEYLLHAKEHAMKQSNSKKSGVKIF